MNTGVKYIGVALPTNGTTVTLFSTVDSFPMQFGAAMTNTHRVTIDLMCDHDGTAKYYESRDRGTTWRQIGTQGVTGSTTASTTLDILIQEYADFKADFLVGGSDETVFDVNISITSQRPLGA